jgi:hypothetical protein
VSNTVSNHKLFTEIAHFTTSGQKKSDREMAVLQSIMVASGLDFDSMAAKHVEKFFTENQISEDLLSDIEFAFNTLTAVFGEHNKFVSKINLPSLVKLILDNQNNLNQVKEFIMWYSVHTDKHDAYRLNCGAGNVKKDVTQKRLAAIQKLFDQWLAAQKAA